MKIVFLAYREWALQVVADISSRHAGRHQFRTLSSPDELRDFVGESVGPDVVLLAIGWSWVIEPDITQHYLCLGVHPSDLPNYRGGSPLQNQIVDGVVMTKCSLFRISERLDAGEIWGKSDLSLAGDSMAEVLSHVKSAAITLIEDLLERYPGILPEPQDLSRGKLVKRRKPEESRLAASDFSQADITPLYNKIRCLTAPYPNAFIEDAHGNRIYFEKIRFERGAAGE